MQLLSVIGISALLATTAYAEPSIHNLGRGVSFPALCMAPVDC